MHLIGLGHKARHGKDTFASAVQGAYGDRMKIRLASFADPLRAEVMEAATTEYNEAFRRVHARQATEAEFNSDSALRLLCHKHGVEFEENAVPDVDYPWGKQRKLHQYWGTEFRRAQDPEYWTNKAIELINRSRREGDFCLIFRDMRFENEYNLLGSLKGWRIKISRLGFDNGVPQHISETALDHVPFDLHVGVRDGELALLQDLSVYTFGRLVAA